VKSLLVFGMVSVGAWALGQELLTENRYDPTTESSARAVVKICLPTAVKIDGEVRITGSYCVDPEDLCFEGSVPVSCSR